MAYDRGYRVSEDGSVVVGPRGRPLRLDIGTRGYLRFSIGRYKQTAANVPVHQLQAYQLYGERCYETNLVVRHLDGNKLNNSARNIALGTASENSLDRIPEERMRAAEHAAKQRRRFGVEQIIEMRQLRAAGASYKVLMRRYGVCKSFLSYVINRRTYNFGVAVGR